MTKQIKISKQVLDASESFRKIKFNIITMMKLLTTFITTLASHHFNVAHAVNVQHESPSPSRAASPDDNENVVHHDKNVVGEVGVVPNIGDVVELRFGLALKNENPSIELKKNTLGYVHEKLKSNLFAVLLATDNILSSKQFILNLPLSHIKFHSTPEDNSDFLARAAMFDKSKLKIANFDQVFNSHKPKYPDKSKPWEDLHYNPPVPAESKEQYELNKFKMVQIDEMVKRHPVVNTDQRDFYSNSNMFESLKLQDLTTILFSNLPFGKLKSKVDTLKFENQSEVSEGSFAGHRKNKDKNLSNSALRLTPRKKERFVDLRVSENRGRDGVRGLEFLEQI